MSSTTAVRMAPKKPVRSRIAIIWIVLSSVAVSAIWVSMYMTDTLENLATQEVGLAPDYANKGLFIAVVFYLHIIFAGLALVLGPFQFIRWIRENHIRVHRFIGRSYVVSVIIGAATGLIMSTVSSIGLSGFFGFGALAVFWGWFTINAFRAIRRGDVAAHRAWMMRSFALTYAAVTLRLWIGVLLGVQLPFVIGTEFDFEAVFANAYAPVAYLCWIPNLIVAELLIRRRGLPALRMTRGPVEEKVEKVATPA